MAKVEGQSGAFKGVQKALAQVNLSITSLDELTPLQDSITAFHKTAIAKATAEFEAEATRLQTLLKQAEAKLQTTLAEGAPAFEQEKIRIQSKIEQLQAERNAIGSFFRNLYPLTRLLTWWSKYRQFSKTQEELSQHEHQRKKLCKSLAKPVKKQEKELNQYLSSRETYLKARVQTVEEQLACITRLLEKEVGGAAAELEVITKLQQLPEGWIVLNDVNLTLDRWFYYEGEHLKTAQLDHVAIGPGGVFIIETKNWSRQFVEKGEFQNPYNQVARANFVCHKILKEAGAPSKIRGIIATRTHLPEKPKKSYAKVLKPEDLTGYLLWYSQELTPADIEQVTSILSRFVTKD